MFWNLVVINYEKYRMHHVLLFGLLMLYSIAGAFVFCGLESNSEDMRNEEEVKQLVRRSVAAKKELVERIEILYLGVSGSLNETELRKAIDMYDVSMSVKPAIHRRKRWDLWGGLYYAGTIYTTIGYGDLVAVTFWGRLFTMVYAVLGIPMVITILNDWGTIMFIVANKLWRHKYCSLVHPLKLLFRRRKRKGSQESICETPTPPAKPEPLAGDPDEAEPIPLILVAVVLLFWLAVCCSVFVYFEKWTYFETIYFFFISLTTIGFGDVTPSHRVAVANFLLILVGLSVVSMAINVVQMQLEIVFAKVVQSIDNDFKMNLSVSAEDEKKVATQDERGDVERGPSELRPRKEQDVVKQYGEGMSGGERFLMRFMSHHQRKMLNEKFEERSRMRNKWTQTATQIKVASVQTGKFVEPVIPEEELDEDSQPKSGIASKRLYIYNTGE